MEEGGLIPYEYSCKEGDAVLLPNGTPGLVKSCDILCGGNIKRVIVTPITAWWHHLYLAIFGKLTFYGWDIDRLENIEPLLLTPSEG